MAVSILIRNFVRGGPTLYKLERMVKVNNITIESFKTVSASRALATVGLSLGVREKIANGSVEPIITASKKA